VSRRRFCGWLLGLVCCWLCQAAEAGSYDEFFKAVRNDDASTLSALLQRGFDPNTINPEGQNALYLALREDASRVVNALLLAPKMRVDVRNLNDETPLMMACLKGRLDWIQQLVGRGADINKPGWTPLHYAAFGGHADVIAYLLAQHAYIDAESPNRSTPLMVAARYGSLAAVKALVEAGADTRLKNEQDMTALDFARNPDRPDMLAYLQAVAGLPSGPVGP
jgi:uncharacterized protein